MLINMKKDDNPNVIYYKYRRKFLKYVNQNWEQWHPNRTNYKKILKKRKFVEYMDTKYNDKFPFLYNVYWAYKHACGININGNDNHYLNEYIQQVMYWNRPTPTWMTNDFPSSTQIPGFIDVASALNDRKFELKYETTIEFWPQVRPSSPNSTGSVMRPIQCDIIDWLVENCNYEWFFSIFVTEVTVKFLNEADAFAFKLRWS